MKARKKAAVVTGATGMIGTALVSLLLEAGYQVTALVRSGSAKRERLPMHEFLHIMDADLSELGKNEIYEGILAKTGGAEFFFHLGWSGTFGPDRNHMYLQNENIRYTLDAVNLAGRLGCKAFVGAGSQAEYGRKAEKEKLSAKSSAFPENGYGIAKLAAGQMSRILCREKGIRHEWARILSVYGPWDTDNTMVMSAVSGLLKNERPVFSRGEQLWDYLYASDAARALYLMAEKGVDGRIYPVGSGKAVPLKDYILKIREIANPKGEIGIGELPYAGGQVMYLCADIGELTKDTGFIPEISFEEGIRNTVLWYKRNKTV